MAKPRTFAAKLAHEISTEGKEICPNCNIEVKSVKLVRARKSKSESWTPRYDFRKICKCNEKDLFAGNIQ